MPWSWLCSAESLACSFVRCVTGSRSAPINAAMILVVSRPDARPETVIGALLAELTASDDVDIGEALAQRLSGCELECLSGRQAPHGIAVAIDQLDRHALPDCYREAQLVSVFPQLLLDPAGDSDLLEQLRRRTAPAGDEPRAGLASTQCGDERTDVLGAVGC